MMAARSREVVVLYRQLLKESKKFPAYMYRAYALRRIKDSFREHKGETDVETINDLISFGKRNLEIIKRQVVIGQLYRSPDGVLEKEVPFKEKSLQGG